MVRVVVALVGGCIVFAVPLGGCVASLSGSGGNAGDTSDPAATHQSGPAVPAGWDVLDPVSYTHLDVYKRQR